MNDSAAMGEFAVSMAAAAAAAAATFESDSHDAMTSSRWSTATTKIAGSMRNSAVESCCIEEGGSCTTTSSFPSIQSLARVAAEPTRRRTRFKPSPAETAGLTGVPSSRHSSSWPGVITSNVVFAALALRLRLVRKVHGSHRFRHVWQRGRILDAGIAHAHRARIRRRGVSLLVLALGAHLVARVLQARDAPPLVRVVPLGATFNLRELVKGDVRRHDQLPQGLLPAHFADAIDLPTLKRHQDRIRSGLADIEQRLAQHDEHHTGGRVFLHDSLRLLTDAHHAYTHSDDGNRRLANQAFYTRLEITEDEQLRPRLADPFATIVHEAAGDKEAKREHPASSDVAYSRKTLWVEAVGLEPTSLGLTQNHIWSHSMAWKRPISEYAMPRPPPWRSEDILARADGGTPVGHDPNPEPAGARHRGVGSSHLRRSIGCQRRDQPKLQYGVRPR